MEPVSGWKSSEFWLAVAALAGKIIVLLVSVNVIRTTDPEHLTSVVTQVILAIGTVWGITHGSTTYMKQRTDLKMRTMGFPPRQPGLR